jgi:hypothetical protein
MGAQIKSRNQIKNFKGKKFSLCLDETYGLSTSNKIYLPYYNLIVKLVLQHYPVLLFYNII